MVFNIPSTRSDYFLTTVTIRMLWKCTTLFGTITAVMTASAVIGNATVVGVILLNKTLRSPTFTLIVFLAVSIKLT